eukprot:2868908-Heterocapsa_arctica.AAC.1
MPARWVPRGRRGISPAPGRWHGATPSSWHPPCRHHGGHSAARPPSHPSAAAPPAPEALPRHDLPQ